MRLPWARSASRRAFTTALVVVTGLVASTSGAHADPRGRESVSCAEVTESTVNDWIRRANGGATVLRKVDTGASGCTVPVGPTGLEPLSGRLILTAVGGNLTLHGGDSVFDVRNGGVLTINRLTLSGSTSSAVVNNYGGTVVVNSSTITGNHAFFGGGLVNSGGTMTINDTTITGNTSQGQGGGLGNSGSTGFLVVTNSRITRNNGLYGGGLINAGATTYVIGSEISENTSDGAAAGVVNSAGSLTVIGSTVARNTVLRCPGPSLCGGGFTNAGNLTILRSVVSGHNESAIGNLGGGALQVTNSKVEDNSAPGPGAGVISALGGVVTIKDSEFTRNRTDASGGAVANTGGGVITLERTRITGNSAAVDGGGLANLGNGMVTVTTGSVVTGNAPDDCAGVVEGCQS